MKLATFNLESFGTNRIGDAGLAARIDALRPKLLELEADILCLQEVNAQKLKGEPGRRFHDLGRLIEGTRYETYHLAASEWAPGQGPADRHNLVVLSKYPVTAQESLHDTAANPPLWQPATAVPPLTAPERISFDRPILRTRIDLGDDRPLHLFSVHLRAPIAAAIPGGKTRSRQWRSGAAWAEGYHLSVMKQISQALQLRLHVEALFDRDPDPRIVLAGDFNATGDTGTLRLLRADPDDTGNPDLAPRRLYQLDASLPLEARKTVLHKGNAQTLDHVLASPALTDRVTGVRVFNNALADEVFEGDNPDFAGSYHAAMRVTFDLD